MVDVDKLFAPCQSTELHSELRTALLRLRMAGSDVERRGEMFGSLIATVAALAMVVSFQFSLREWLPPLLTVDAISLIAGLVVGAFLGLCTFKRIVARRAHR